MIATVKIKYYNIRYLYHKIIYFPFEVEKFDERCEGKNYIFTLKIFSPNPQLEMKMIAKEFDTDFECSISGHTLTVKFINKEIKLYAEDNSVLFKSRYTENYGSRSYPHN